MRSTGRTARRFLVVFTAALMMIGGGLPLAQAGNTVFDSPDLPPLGKYHHIGPVFFLIPDGDIGLGNILHFPFPGAQREPDGPHEIETFGSQLRADVSVGAQPPFQMFLQGPVRVEVFNKIGNTTGTFDTEMLAMSLTGNSPLGPIMIRESPTLHSLGKTSIDDLGQGGPYRIDSFFDVFTELSLDGGQNWIPSQGPARVQLVPEPTALLLLGIGLGALFGRRWLRRKQAA